MFFLETGPLFRSQGLVEQAPPPTPPPPHPSLSEGLDSPLDTATATFRLRDMGEALIEPTW